MNPLVSVVVTTYNQASYIEETLESVFAQTYRSYEVIVVDDGSTDDTPSRIAPFRDRIIYVRQDNQGVAGSRNTGIRKARGEFVAFLDGDDLWEPDKLSFQVAAAERHPESGLIAVDGLQFGENGIIETSLLFGPFCRDLPVHSITQGNYYHQLLNSQLIYTTSQVMIPARVFDVVGLSDEQFKRASDYDLYIRIAAKLDFTIIRKRLTKWRYLSSSASGPLDLRFINYFLENLRILKKQLKVCKVTDRALIRNIIREKTADGVEKLYKYGIESDRAHATKIFLKLFTQMPMHTFSLCCLVGLWCPSFLRRKIAPAVRRILCRVDGQPTLNS